jgi:myo-inositol-1(or 4)-monophosphatase
MQSLGQEELNEIYAFAIQLGKDAGKILLERAQERFQGDDQKLQTHVEKANAVDLVTQTDEGTRKWLASDLIQKRVVGR